MPFRTQKPCWLTKEEPAFGLDPEDSNSFRDLLKSRGIEACIPPTAQRKIQFRFDKTLYKQRHKIENMFGKLKDWRRVSTRYDRCAHTFMSAIIIAATMIFWINQ